ncbi:MAG: thiamine pyrophosphate-binding protein [Deltaproteobacteria bacterium]
MANVSGGRLVARMLKEEGVRAIFTLSGLHVAPIYAGCVDEGIQVVDMRHEQAAAHAADAYARLTRGIGVAVVTAGPGVTDALTGVANAFAANSPLLLLGGAAPTFNAGKGSLQEIEQVDLFLRITKWADRVPEARLLPAYLARAFRIALSGRPGPVFLELPFDALMAELDEAEAPLPKGYRTRFRPAPDHRAIEAAAALLDRAERPAVIAGSSIWWDDAAGPLGALGERAELPIYLNGAGRGCLPPGHPCFFQQTRKEMLSQADAVLVVGTPLDFRLGYGESFAPSAKLVQIDIDPSEIGRNREIDVGIPSDSRLALEALASAVARGGAPRRGLLEGLRVKERASREKLEPLCQSDQTPLHHFRVAREISLAAKRAGDVTFVADGGNFVAMAAKVIEVERPGRWLDPGPLGCLGVGAPFAVAAKVLHPERSVLVIQGDGSFGLNGFDFETALRFELPMVVVVGNDAAWGQIRLPQVGMFGEERSPGTALAPTRYDRVVEAFGGHGEHVERPEALGPALDRAFASGTVACVDVALDPAAPMTSGAMGYAL